MGGLCLGVEINSFMFRFILSKWPFQRGWPLNKGCLSKGVPLYRIRPNYHPCPHNRPPDFFTLFSLIITDLTIFVLTFYFIFTYYRPLDDLLALVVENKFT